MWSGFYRITCPYKKAMNRYSGLHNAYGFYLTTTRRSKCLLHPGGCNVFRTCRTFHTTQVKYMHPLLWILFRPIAKLSAILVGRGVRKWWSDLPANKRVLFIESLKRNKYKILGTIGVTGGLGALYYGTHLQESAITKRKRFIIFNSDQIIEFADFQHQMLAAEFEGQQYIPSHLLYQRVQKLVDRLIKANQDIPEISNRSWLVTVIDSETENSFVLPNGQIYVHRGMTNLCHNDDQLAIILAHEMAHAVLNHGSEQMSYYRLLDLLTIVLIAAIWTILPTDIISALVHWLMRRLMVLVLELPYSRNLEVEADEVGLLLAAKACIDVRESVAFWSRLNKSQKDNDELNPEWLSTHPAHEKRSGFLEEKLPEALQLRLSCNCPPLPNSNPEKRPSKVANNVIELKVATS